MSNPNPFAFDDDTPASVNAPVATMTAPVPVPTTPVAMGEDDPFAGPAPQRPRGPRVPDIYGRLLLILPHKLEENVPNKKDPGKFQDRMTADVIVLDGGLIAYGGRPEETPPIPHDKTASVPHKTARQFISHTGLISQCRDALAKRLRGEPGMVLGRLTRSSEGNRPYLLTPPTEADKQLARQYLSTVDPFS